MTARQRDAGTTCPRGLAGPLHGDVPKRSGAVVPLPWRATVSLGLMGFPGVGWLFAGFPFTASILLMAGPALAWAIIPVAFSPYGQGPLRPEG